MFFLATTGAGKSTLTEEIVRQLHATYLSNDEVRGLLASRDSGVHPKEVINRTWELIRKESANQFIVFDSSIIAVHADPHSYFNMAGVNGYESFLIAINIPAATLSERIIRRKRSDMDDDLKNLAYRYDLHQKVMTELCPDILISDMSASSVDQVIEALGRKMLQDPRMSA
ncbi:AAA family ATPase [Mycobacteroides abscessus]|uniref:AAA family ATPase n=1 Tax=Mycobacteroides abscessus TaxID=36809 RepID=UPI0009CA6D3B|nr:AAA family ATPase [Mycobacteroides abscessus]SKT99581.1 Uncharacterised protein [Mycobacteroides abscessus subsp. massiliense]SKU19181.1 Uncharacterised protein [Mycobacteroides abscessus subsp. massiliense]